MAALSPPRLLAAWRVDAFLFFSAVFPFGGICELHSICADVFPCMTKCLGIGKSLKHSEAIRTTP